MGDEGERGGIEPKTVPQKLITDAFTDGPNITVTVGDVAMVVGGVISPLVRLQRLNHCPDQGFAPIMDRDGFPANPGLILVGEPNLVPIAFGCRVNNPLLPHLLHKVNHLKVSCVDMASHCLLGRLSHNRRKLLVVPTKQDFCLATHQQAIVRITDH